MRPAPAVGLNNPVSMLMVEVLPAPLWPNRQKIWSLYILRFMPLTAFVPSGYYMVRPSTISTLSYAAFRAISGATGS